MNTDKSTDERRPMPARFKGPLGQAGGALTVSGRIRVRPGRRPCSSVSALVLAAAMLAARPQARAQEDTTVITIDLAVGRSFPITTAQAITRVSVATPEIADVVVVSEREVVINAKAPGETDAILWPAAGTRTHYRIRVHSPLERRQVALYVKFAEVRRDALRNLGVGLRYEDANTTVDAGSTLSGGTGTAPEAESFLTVLTTLGTRNLLVAIDAAARQGNARI